MQAGQQLWHLVQLSNFIERIISQTLWIINKGLRSNNIMAWLRITLPYLLVALFCIIQGNLHEHNNLRLILRKNAQSGSQGLVKVAFISVC